MARTTPTAQANGIIDFPACEPDTYKVTELTPPPGYFLPGDLSTTKTVEVGGSATFTFEDPLAEIRWQKEDAAGQLLGGAEFSITPNPRTGSGSLAVVDNGANDADDTAGKFAVRRVLIGGPYVIAETQPPAGYIGTSATYSVTIAADLASPHRVTVPAGTFVNTLGSIRLAEGRRRREPPRRLDVHRHSQSVDRRGQPLTVVDNGANDSEPAARQVPRQQRPDRHVLHRGDGCADGLHPRRQPRERHGLRGDPAPAGRCRHLRQPPRQDPLAQGRAGRQDPPRRRCLQRQPGSGDRNRFAERR